MLDYIRSAADGMTASAAFVLAGVAWLLFPDGAYFSAFVAVFAAAGLDIITRYVAESKRSGGLMVAFSSGRLSSDRLFKGTIVKIYAYLIVAILVGLAHKVTVFREASLFAGTFVYSVLFLREVQSILENLIETGADLGWLALFVKRKERELMQKQGIEEEAKSEQPNDGDLGTPTI